MASTRLAALIVGTAVMLAGCESTPEAAGAPDAPEAGLAAEAIAPDQGGPEPALTGNTWQPVDFTGCQVPWGLAVMVEDTGITQREFTFNSGGSIAVRQVQSPRNPNNVSTYSLAYHRRGPKLDIRAGLGTDTWTIKELTTARLLLEDDSSGSQCWLRRVG
ncbi:hypothetical protein [Cryptosporangium phraense]|uniref:Lipoprotein n=1 Tax=Cryptosporangium phraense TaxID=2593070 RepID=A0A545AYG6_9ACTN|nr:hypothetical protein [Cryptosporangium phraense]TQS45625.1 hypothetical protein FL583_07820 [Cryptosporangium phraense]